MGKKLYVRNLVYAVTDSDLSAMFETHGTVESAQVIMEGETGRSKGFGFLEMKNDQEARTAIHALSGQDSEGRALTVTEARPWRTENQYGGRRCSKVSQMCESTVGAEPTGCRSRSLSAKFRFEFGESKAL